jgi:mono/diheme cytochrome c family protein
MRSASAGYRRRVAPKRALHGMAAVVVAAVLGACGGSDGEQQLTRAELVERGDELYHGEGTCQTCHGPDLRGTTMGPSFIDAIYAPGHHPDEAFFAAAKNGVQPHHWNFGPMPALAHLDEDEIEAIVAYVRDRQRAAGIR